MRAVFQAGAGDGGRDHHLLAQMEDRPPGGRHEGIDSREQSPGTRNVRLLPASHHVKLALQEAEIPRKAKSHLMAPVLSLAMLVEIVRREKKPVGNIRCIIEIR